MIAPFLGLALLFLLAAPAWAASLTLTWTDNNAAPSNETGTIVERAPASGTPLAPSGAFAQVGAALPPDTVSYIDSTVTVGAYCYRVAAINQYGQSAYSNVACAGIKPNAPSILNVTILWPAEGEVVPLGAVKIIGEVDGFDGPLRQAVAHLDGRPPAVVKLDRVTGLFSIAATIKDPGEHVVGVAVWDAEGRVASLTRTWLVQ